MNLDVHVEGIQHQLAIAAEAGGEEARALAERLTAPLEAAVRLTLLDVLDVAAREITCDLAPGSVELRLRRRSVEFVVTPPAEPSAGSDAATAPERPPSPLPPYVREEAEGSLARINLRLPEALKAQVERAAAHEGLSVNAWLVRAVAAAAETGGATHRQERWPPLGGQRFTGWVR